METWNNPLEIGCSDLRSDDHTYNLDDFLHQSGVRETAKRDFGLVYFALYSSLISDEFLRLDTIANQRKRTLQNYGAFTIALAFSALALAAIDIALLAPIEPKSALQELLALALPLAAAGSGILSFIIGYFGAGIGKRKRAWLVLRMKTELIRQWKARFYLNNRNVILHAAECKSSQQTFTKEMRAKFQDFTKKIDKNSNELFRNIVSSDSYEIHHQWLGEHLDRKAAKDITENYNKTAIDQFYLAYQYMRIKGQERYSDYISTLTGAFRTHPRVQKDRLHSIGIISVFSIVFLHVLVTLGVLTGIKELKSIYVHLMTVMLALLALAVRAMEDGLRPHDHLNRYAAYFAKVQYLSQMFDRAQTEQSKHDCAWELEEAAYEEMVSFLKGSDKAQFMM